MEKFAVSKKNKVEFIDSITFAPMDCIEVSIATIVIKHSDGKRFVSAMIGVEEGAGKVIPLTLHIYYTFDDAETDEEVAYEAATYIDAFVQHLDTNVIVLNDDGTTSSFEIDLGDDE